MKILIIGSGGREHALAWKIFRSPLVRELYCAPGNAGISGVAECVSIPADDIEGLLAFALDKKIDLTIVGPEAPLTMGIADRFLENGLQVFGPGKKAAEIEGSKSFAKYIMNKYGVPTAKAARFRDFEEAGAYIRKMGAPLVIKADGLAAGKGVIVCQTEEEAIDAADRILNQKEFGHAGDSILVEEFLRGEEASFIVFTDGMNVLPLPSSQDHKPVFDNDQGPNTGGMGAYSPAPLIDRVMHARIMEEVMIPTIMGMAREGRPYKGVLYAGLMIDRDRIRVLEFNARFGDPEAQPLLMRMKSDIVPVLQAAVSERLDEVQLEIDERSAVCVVMASHGYPGSYEKGKPIFGLEAAKELENVEVFHAGTKIADDQVVTSGGRVLGVTGLGITVSEAIDRTYDAISGISWDGAFYRKDIGQKAVKRLSIPSQVGIIMGSDSDLAVMEEAVKVLKSFDVPFEMTVASAHRSPERAARLAAKARKKGIRVLIAAAGHAAHLAGVIAAHTTLPVIGVPIDSSCLSGWDALLSTVQMPGGIPVATVSIGKSGAKNAAILAVQMLSLSDERLAEELQAYKEKLADGVAEKARAISCPL